MKLEKIIEILGNAVGKKFIVRRRLEQNSTFKAYYNYIIEIYSNTKESRDFELIFSHSTVFNNKDKNIPEIEEEFLRKFTEKHYGIQQIPDSTD